MYSVNAGKGRHFLAMVNESVKQFYSKHHRAFDSVFFMHACEHPNMIVPQSHMQSSRTILENNLIIWRQNIAFSMDQL